MRVFGRQQTMKSAVGMIRNGRVEFDKPIEWQSGTRVRVTPEEEPFGIPEEDWPTTLEGIQELLAKIDALEPLELTPEEEAEIEAARAEVRRVTLDAMRKQMGL
jgi:hypothetical protein